MTSAPTTRSPFGAGMFTAEHEHVHLPGIGHIVPQEAPPAFADAVRGWLGRVEPWTSC